jgi:enoyl-[acyl-carrier protein] reductase II
MTSNEAARLTARKRLDTLWQRGRAFLGTDLAILGGAMTWVSDHNLVSAISNGGGFGILASGAMPPEVLSEEIQRTKALTDKPFGVNLITMHPQLDALIDICADHRIGHVALAGGLPPRGSVQRIKDGGAKVMCFAPTLSIAKKLVRTGADAIIIEGMEAGGHIGPVSTAVLAQEILPYLQDVPVFIAGGIGRGNAIVMYLEMGASGCQLGTRFVCATESIAHEKFKQAFIRANARDAIVTVQVDPQFSVIPVRALNNGGTQKFVETQHDVIARFRRGEMDLKSAQLEIEQFWAGALRRAVIDGDVEFGSMMAGQSVGMVKSIQPTAEILSELVEQAVDTLASRQVAEAGTV